MLMAIANQAGDIVIVLLLVLGGRHERAVGLTLAAGTLASLAVLLTAGGAGHIALAGQALVQAAVLAVLARLWRRTRKTWLLAVTAIHLTSVTLVAAAAVSRWTHEPAASLYPLIRWPVFYLSLGKYAVLLWAVAHRWLAPPRPVPPSDAELGGR